MPKCWAPIRPPQSRRLCPPLLPLPQLPQRPKSKLWTPSPPTSAFLPRPSHSSNPLQLQRRPRRPLPPRLNLLLLRPHPRRDPNLVPQYPGRSPRRLSSPALRRQWVDNRSLRPPPPPFPLRPSSQRPSRSEHRSRRSRRSHLPRRTQSRRRRLQERPRGCQTLPLC